MAFFVYILASRRNGTLYIGYTDDIHRRVSEHKARSLRGFTAKYDVDRLVWCETHEEMAKTWRLELIERFNPVWRDLFEDFN